MPSLTTIPSNDAQTHTSPSGRCTQLRADGKRCADAVYSGHSSLCHYHLSREMRGISAGDLIAADLLSSVGNFQSASAINIVLGKLIIHQLTGRIARREAVALAYTCQLLLQTLPQVKQELKETGFSSYWRDETKRILGQSSDLDQITEPTLLPEANIFLHPADHEEHEDQEPAQPAQPTPASSSTPSSARSTSSPSTSAPSSFAQSANPPAAPNSARSS